MNSKTIRAPEGDSVSSDELEEVVRNVPEVESARELHVEPTDVIVVRLRNYVEPLQVWRIREQLEPLFPGRKILITDDDVELDTLRELVEKIIKGEETL